MAKKKRTTGAVNRRDVADDKPDWAADIFREPVKVKKPKETRDESAITMKDHLNASLADKLGELKREMEESVRKSEEQAKAQAKRATARRPQSGSGKSKGGEVDDERELSFHELFDPEDEEEAAFSELLKDSKLDWRHFK